MTSDKPTSSGLINGDFIYLDNNATTPLAPQVLQALNRSAVSAFANPSSSSILGKSAKKLIADSRAELATLLNCRPCDLVFTSGGTESNNWVIYSAIRYFNSLKNDSSKIPHIITCTIEHDSILEPLRKFEAEGQVKVTYLPVEKHSGTVSATVVENALQDDTILVTLMLANNETGAIFPIAKIMKTVKSKKRNVLCHADAAQAIGKISIDVEELCVDYLTIVGHKFYGPRAGALYARGLGVETPLSPIFFGGGQERGFRAGTENTPVIVGLGAAARLINANLFDYSSHMLQMKTFFVEQLKARFPEDCLHFNNVFRDGTPVLPNTLSVGFYSKDWKFFTGSAILNNMAKVVASVGAACNSSSSQTKPSKVLLECGIDYDVALRSIRISVGRQTTKEEIVEAVTQLYNSVCMVAEVKL